ncbi:phosphorylase family protein [Alcaligenes sp. SDU_A2]|uniref:phosphorylase family protein n=1 Tax=Alcaligenes sp. SDU_A2 TaxID=3136634 RepID=UPI00311FE002
MKLLIVDDSHTKVEKVAIAIQHAGVEVDIAHETNATSARHRLRTEEFDLLLIDLQLPDIAGASPNQSGGLHFFDLVINDTKTILPGEVLFVTSQTGLEQAGRKEVEQRGSALCVISDGLVDWMSVLVGQIQLAAKRSSRKLLPADVAIITALGSELDAVLKLDFGWKNFRVAGDPTLYHRGEIQTQQGKKSIVVASALRKGMAASAVIATKLALKFKPGILAMTGICAGVKGKTNLGDVVIGDPTWDWGSGKHAHNDEGSPVFHLSPKQSDLNVDLANRCDEIARCAEFHRNIRANWEGAVPPGKFGCHIGPMASGASVVANSSIAREISAQNRDLIAIEMEAFAVMVAAEYATTSPLLSVAVKSVCDYADKDKHDDWQAYAAYTSAQFVAELLRRHFSEL